MRSLIAALLGFLLVAGAADAQVTMSPYPGPDREPQAPEKEEPPQAPAAEPPPQAP